MKNISSFHLVLLSGAFALLIGCQVGGETMLGSVATSHEGAGVALAKPAGPRIPDSNDSSTSGAVTLTAARADSDPWEPALITLAVGDDVRRYLDGSRRRVILDFYADWCGPCRQQGRLLHEFESTASDADALIIKINVDQHRELAQALSVKGLPTLMVYGEGTILQRRTGLTDTHQLQAWVR